MWRKKPSAIALVQIPTGILMLTGAVKRLLTIAASDYTEVQ